MKKINFFIILFLITIHVYSQETKITWNDNKGREFTITAPSGNFSYSFLSGDNIEYGSRYSDSPGKEIKIGDVYIDYGKPYSNSPGKIIKVGDVEIEYGSKYSNENGKVIKVGRLEIEYGSEYSNAPGRIIGTKGRVR